MPTIRPPTTLRFGSTVPLLASLPGPHERAREDIVMQMGQLRWIEALPLAILAAYLNDHRRRSHRGGRITVPQRYGFLQRMDFFQTIGVQIRETFRRREPSGRFVPVREVGGSREVHEASAEIVETLRVDDKEAANILRHCIGEVIDNVFVHANSPTNATICAQHFPNARRTQLGIVDTGIGFRESFAASPVYSSMSLTDRDSITLGLAPYVTSKPYAVGMYDSGYGRLGVGLFIVTNLLNEIGGRIQIVSGSALFHGEKWFTVRPWQGAIIGFEVPDVPRVSYQDALRAARDRAITIARAREAG
jgi:anti-sigma regulatory factor (Ser/Thr protein kinase)